MAIRRSVSEQIFEGLYGNLQRQLDGVEPEIVDVLHQHLKRLQLHRLVQITVRLQLVAADDVNLSLGWMTVGIILRLSSSLM